MQLTPFDLMSWRLFSPALSGSIKCATRFLPVLDNLLPGGERGERLLAAKLILIHQHLFLNLL